MWARDLHTFSSGQLETRISPQEANEKNNIKLGAKHLKIKGKLDPYYISGLTDACGSFSVICTRHKNLELG